MSQRVLAWDGCLNVRDLGGLRTDDGRMTRRGSIIRSDTPARLTPAGWSELYAYGVRTIVTLCTHGLEEAELEVTPPQADVTVTRVAIEDITDQEFVARWVNNNFWGTPLYFGDALRRWPERHAAALCAIARAQPGGVVFHCRRGHDRTGIISLLLLALAGVALDEIAADYALSRDPERDDVLARAGVTVPAALRGALEGLELDRYLMAGGATSADLAALRRRLLE